VEFLTHATRNQILSLPVAISSDGFCLFYTKSFVESYGNIDDHRAGMAVAYDDRARGWIVGKGMARYQIFNTMGVILQKKLEKPFPAGEQHQLEVKDGELTAKNKSNHWFKAKIIEI
tara:strand:- start:237 stop:587 length:351 start_codon:yes stop_codon:yes gene_type:complete